MTDLLKQAYNSSTFREEGHQLVDLLADYLQANTHDSIGNVMNWKEPDEQYAFWGKQLQDPSSLSDLFRSVIERSNHLHHTKYIGHQLSPTVPSAALSSFLGAFLNNGSAVYEMGPVNSVMERIVIDHLGKAIGYDPKAEGFLTSGGTLANLTALLAARSKLKDEDVWENGNTAHLAVMVSEEAHYCIDRAVRIMGWGSKGIIKIPVTDHYVMDTKLLESAYQKTLREGIKVIAVIGSACSTSTGKYDDLKTIAQFCKKHGLWFHVDGAHGGGAVFSKSYRGLTEGINEADSIVVDFHKMMAAPALLTALIFKNGANSYGTFQQKAQYLLDATSDKDWYNLAKRSFECTKLMMGLKVYTVIHAHGTKFFDDFVTVTYDLGRRFADRIAMRKHFELAVQPDSNIVCFRYSGKDLDEESINRLNAEIRRKHLEEGRFYFVQTSLRKKTFLRVSLMNPFTTIEELDLLLDEIEKTAEQI
jgi:L-2,4-diaminobutyrate decarboxylase